MKSGLTDRANVLGCEIDRLDLVQTIERCDHLIETQAMVQHAAINAAKLVAFQNDSRLREIIRNCELVSADGQSVVVAARLLGDPVPERVAGIDLMHELLYLAERKAYRVFFLGATREVLEEAVRRIKQLHPRLLVAGYRDGYFADSESRDVCTEIRRAEPHILFVAMSSPRKEYWLAEHRNELGVPFVMGVGGAIDVVAGLRRRAPGWLQRFGLEWFFRLLQEPTRLGRRYLVGNLRFALLLWRAILRRRKSAP
jgi:N-acetylglucosaminyldiphosphoundecaprenol N-acetyl-beta-D-mannosaminyltransferase